VSPTQADDVHRNLARARAGRNAAGLSATLT